MSQNKVKAVQLVASSLALVVGLLWENHTQECSNECISFFLSAGQLEIQVRHWYRFARGRSDQESTLGATFGVFVPAG